MITCGIVLAGGQSTRFGSPKAFAIEQGRPFYEWSYNILYEICDYVIIVTLAEHMSWFPKHMNVMTDRDEVKGKGPLAGIYSAMLNVKADRYVVLPCDMPYLSSDGLTQMLSIANDYSIYAMQLDGQYHPLVSCWPHYALSAIEHALKQEQLSVMSLLKQQPTVWLDGATHFDRASYRLQNLNRPRKK